MVKKIRLLGMIIDNFTLHEEMLQSEEFYNRQELNIIRTISIEMLNTAANSQVVREGIRQADLLVVADKEILTAAGIYSGQRLQEASEHGFMLEYLKHISCIQRRIFLVAGDKGELGLLSEYLHSAYEKIQIVGSYVLDECGSDYDMMINEINAAAADIVLSVLDSPEEDEFLLQAKAKISARVWYSLGRNYQNRKGRLSVMFWLRQLIYRGRFRSAIHHYKMQNKI